MVMAAAGATAALAADGATAAGVSFWAPGCGLRRLSCYASPRMLLVGSASPERVLVVLCVCVCAGNNWGSGYGGGWGSGFGGYGGWGRK